MNRSGIESLSKDKSIDRLLKLHAANKTLCAENARLHERRPDGGRKASVET